MGLEGIVSKRAGSPYRGGPSKSWLKCKATTEAEFVVIGTEYSPGNPPFALLARVELEGLAYAGSAFVTLPQAERDRFWRTAEVLACAKCRIQEHCSALRWLEVHPGLSGVGCDCSW